MSATLSYFKTLSTGPPGRVDLVTFRSAIQSEESVKETRVGGTPHMKGVGILVGNFELNH